MKKARLIQPTTTSNSDTELDQDSSDMDETVELDDTLSQFDPLYRSNGAPAIETEGNFVNLSIVEAAQNNSTLTTLKRHLREKYLNDIDVIQRSTARDPEAWKNIEKITEEIETLQKLLRDTEDLTLPTNQENEHPLNEKPQIA